MPASAPGVQEFQAMRTSCESSPESPVEWPDDSPGSCTPNFDLYCLFGSGGNLKETVLDTWQRVLLLGVKAKGVRSGDRR